MTDLKIYRSQTYFYILQSLIVGALETFGHCLLVFKVLPTMDIVRGVMLLSCVGFMPGVTRLIFGKESKTVSWQIRKFAE